MARNKTLQVLLAASVVLSAAALSACNQTSGNTSSAAAAYGGKLAVTSRSEQAKQEFLEGRDLSERLLGQESLQHFDKALSLDPEFASAELARANNSPTAKEFFDHLKKAVNLADRASDGEKLLILANEAAANGDTGNRRTISTGW